MQDTSSASCTAHRGGVEQRGPGVKHGARCGGVRQAPSLQRACALCSRAGPGRRRQLDAPGFRVRRQGRGRHQARQRHVLQVRGRVWCCAAGAGLLHALSERSERRQGCAGVKEARSLGAAAIKAQRAGAPLAAAVCEHARHVRGRQTSPPWWHVRRLRGAAAPHLRALCQVKRHTSKRDTCVS